MEDMGAEPWHVAGSPVNALVGKIVAARAARAAPGALVVAFSGPIGAGKTTTIGQVARQLRAAGLAVHVAEEQLPQPLFDKYLADPAAHAWDFQCAMAALRIYNTKNDVVRDVDVVLFDRFIGEDRVFFDANVAAGRIPPARAAGYEAMVGDAVAAFVGRTALLVCCTVSFETTIDRMLRRERAGERDAYLNNPYFQSTYDLWTAWRETQAAVWGDRLHAHDNEPHSPLLCSTAET